MFEKLVYLGSKNGVSFKYRNAFHGILHLSILPNGLSRCFVLGGCTTDGGSAAALKYYVGFPGYEGKQWEESPCVVFAG